MAHERLHNCPELVAYIQQIGILPLLDMGFGDWSAEAQVDEDCQYTRMPDGGWEWPLWLWKGQIIQETGCAYGKFFKGKATFITKEWWPDFCNYRRSLNPYPEEGSVANIILQTLNEAGSMTTRELRQSCGFVGKGMRGKFDAYISRLQHDGYIVTQDFVYPHDQHGKEYGWGWALLTTPEAFLGPQACHPLRSPQESLSLLLKHLHGILPYESMEKLEKLVK